MGEAEGTSTLEEALLGTMLAERYRIDRVVGRGGFGVVFGGHHLTLDVPIAIKVLHLDRVRGTMRDRAFERFQQEAKTLAQLRHPHIARVLDTGVRPADELPRLPWLVMEWYDGPTLTRQLASHSGPGATSRAAGWRLFRPIVEAVAYAHEHGVVHRDLKPDNILLVDGSPIVLDFGIAKVMEADERSASDSAATQSDQRAFTPAYAAPEQVAGVRTGPWTDVHALALILTELLSGRRAYRSGGGAELMREALAEARPTPATHDVDAGPWEPVIEKALAAAAPERFQDAGQLLKALKQTAPELDTVALEHDDTVLDMTESAPPPGLTDEPLAVPRAARTKAPAATARIAWLLAGAALALLLAGAWWLDARHGAAPPSASVNSRPDADRATVPTAHPHGGYDIALIEARLKSAGWEIVERDSDTGPGHQLTRLDIRREGRRGAVTVHEWELSAVYLSALEQLGTDVHGATEGRAPAILHVLVRDHREEAAALLAQLAAGDRAKPQPTPQPIDGSPWERFDVATRVVLNAIAGPAANDLHVVGNHGTALAFDGARWQIDTVESNDDLVSVWAPGGGDAFAVSRAGEVLRREGTRWRRDSAQPAKQVVSVGGHPHRVVALGGDTVWERTDEGWTPTQHVGHSLCLVSSDGQAVDAISCMGTVYRSTEPGKWAKHAEWPETDGVSWPLVGYDWNVKQRGDAPWLEQVEDRGWLPLAFARSGGVIYLTGMDGVILRIDQSLIPKRETSGTDSHLRDVWAGDGAIIVVGGQGSVLRRRIR